LLMSCR